AAANRIPARTAATRRAVACMAWPQARAGARRRNRSVVSGARYFGECASAPHSSRSLATRPRGRTTEAARHLHAGAGAPPDGPVSLREIGTAARRYRHGWKQCSLARATPPPFARGGEGLARAIPP